MTTIIISDFYLFLLKASMALAFILLLTSISFQLYMRLIKKDKSVKTDKTEIVISTAGILYLVWNLLPYGDGTNTISEYVEILIIFAFLAIIYGFIELRRTYLKKR